MSARGSHHTFFVTTRWALVRDAARAGDVEAGQALGKLAGIYWQPLYRYARRKGKTKEDAEDLVQGFLIHLLDARNLGGIDSGRGRFRTFLLGSFNHWMINEWRRGSREKRGGGVSALSLDWESAESGLTLEIRDERSPDRLFDREWAFTLLRSVLDHLEAACIEDGSSGSFAILKPCLTMDSARIPHARIAEQLGATEGAARVAVHRLRKRYRAFLIDEIARTLASPDAVEEEMRSLFAALAG